MPAATGRVLLAALACAGVLAAAACGSTQDAATAPSSSGAASTAADPSETGPASATEAPTGSSSQPPLVGSTPKPRDNAFTLVAGKGVTNVAYSFSGDYFISPGQESTWGGVTGCGPSGSCTIAITAGRHDDSQTWQWFADHVDGFGCNLGSGPCGGVEMNFAFTGTVDIDGTSYPVTLGQYGDGMANKWFWGGPDWTTDGPDHGAITPDGKYTVVPGDGNDKATINAN